MINDAISCSEDLTTHGEPRSLMAACTAVLLLVFLFFLAIAVIGAPTAPHQAAAVVDSWLAMSGRPLGSDLGRQVSEVQAYTDDQGNIAYYIVYLEPKGFVIVSADDLISPIIGFVADGFYDPSSDNPLGALVGSDLKGRHSEIHDLMKSAERRGIPFIPPGRFRKAQRKWIELLARSGSITQSMSGISDVRVAPLLQSQWSQTTSCGNATYNYYVPSYGDGSADNYPCGCVATAMAQLMRFYQYPIGSVGTIGFTISVDGVSRTDHLRGGNGSGGPYDWANMVLAPDCSTNLAQRQAIGALCHDAGISVSMSYKPGGSGADVLKVADAFKNTFGYSYAKKGYSSTSIGSGLNAMINPNLDAGYPILLALKGEANGHAVICDGYGYSISMLYHHLNMGWAGYSDAWYNLPTVDSKTWTFTSIPVCIYNVFLTGSGEIVSGRVTDTDGNPISGATVTVQETSGGTIYGPVTTSNQGIYAIAKVPSNTKFTVTAQHPSYALYSQTVTTDSSKDFNSSSGNKWAIDFMGEAMPAVISFAINNGSATTSSCTVTLNNVCFGNPTYYLASESSSFSGASWHSYSTAPSFSLTSGIGVKRVYFKVKNSFGTQSAVVSEDITVDNTLPDTTANPPGGVYRVARSVELNANKPATIHYTLDGSEPTSDSSVYTAPILISADSLLQFFSIDSVGNPEPTKKREDYFILDGDGSIHDVKRLAVGQQVRLGGKALYFKQPGFAYIEEPDRFSGIRIEGAIPADEGDLVNLIGTIATLPGGERGILLQVMSADGLKPMTSLGACNKSLAERLMDGLYVTAWGIVLPETLSSDSYLISDGSYGTDIEVYTQGTPSVVEGEFVVVTGAAGFNGARVIYAK